MKNYFFLILIVSYIGSVGQNSVYPVLNIPVEHYGKPLRQPWVGGLNAPQLTQGDLNGDGLNDLFAFDRSGNKSLVFLNNGSNSDTAFDYSPFHDLTLPEMLLHAQVRDYNYDSVPDIFTYTPTGTKLYKGTRNGNTVYFELVSNLLLYNDGNAYTYMFSLADDFSPFVDVNGDGDLDFLTFGLLSTVQYYENQTIELGLPYDSIRFAAPVTCWGHFSEDAAAASINLISCKSDGMITVSDEGDGSRHAGGSTIYGFDREGDNDIDLVIGDFGWEKLTYLQNCGTNGNASMCLIDSLFPVCDVPHSNIVYPTAFGVDADNDHLTDMLIAPNPISGTSDVKNINYYRNTGDTSCPFEFVSDTFLVGQMLDFGTDSKPTLFDYNNDGLMDIVVGNFGYYRPFQPYLSQLALLENYGSNTEPRFRVKELNYSNLAQYQLVGIHPAFGDLDGDGYKDLLIGDLTGYLHYFKSPSSYPVSFSSITSNFMGIDVGQYSAPFVYDVNGDGLNDLIVGKKGGKLSYLWNYGTATNPLFSTDSMNANFGSVSVVSPNTNEGYSQPFVRLDSAGNKILYVGNKEGLVSKYLIDAAKLRSGSFTLLTNNALGFDVGVKSALAAADLNSDGKTDFVVGNSRGGLNFFSEALLDTSILLAVEDLDSYGVESSFRVFPNPASSELQIQVTDDNARMESIQIYDMIGNSFTACIKTSVNGAATIDLNSLRNGLYVLVVNGQFSNSKKILVKH